MKASLLLGTRRVFKTEAGRTIVVVMDLYEIPEGADRYRFSWIAFDEADPSRRILFDCHPPKGPHFHVDDDSEGSREVRKALRSARAWR